MISKELRDSIRKLSYEIPDNDALYISINDDPNTDLTLEDFRALLDLADERDRFRELLVELHDYFDQRADADCEGDPLRYIPNEEMVLLGKIECTLEGKE